MPRLKLATRADKSAGRWPLLVVLACCEIGRSCLADPLHATQDGTFWHHDSGWLFPAAIGDFARVGMPQDIAGSTTAEGHYAQALHDGRVTVTVEIILEDSGVETEQELDKPRATASSERSFKVGPDDRFVATAVSFSSEDDENLRAHYLVDTGDWLVRIRAVAPVTSGNSIETVDAFVRAQRWDALGLTAPPSTS